MSEGDADLPRGASPEPAVEALLQTVLSSIYLVLQVVSADQIHLNPAQLVKYLNGLRASVKAKVHDEHFDALVPEAVEYQEAALATLQSVRLAGLALNAYAQTYLGQSLYPFGQSQQQINALQQALAENQRQLNEAILREADVRRTLLNTANAQPYALDPGDTRIRRMDQSESRLFHECLLCYGVGAYAGAIALCGTVAEGLVQRACELRGLSGDSFGAKVKALREAGVLKHQYDDMVSIVTTYRNLTTHPSPEEFNREKANLVIGATLILVDEVF